MENYRRWLIGLTAIVLAAGWLGMAFAVRVTEDELKSKLLLRAATAATMISHERVERLTAMAVDSGSPDYEYLREQLIAARALNTDCRFIYLFKIVDNRMLLLMDSEPMTSEDYAPPGYEYKQASDELYQIFSDGEAFVEGPLGDEWGLWVSGIAAVRNPTDGRVIAALGIDIAGRDWQAAVATARLVAMGVTLSVLMMVYALFYALYTAATADRKVYFVERQAKEAAQVASQGKSQFLAYLSHEVRTPVNGILGLGELIEATLLDRQQRDYVSAIIYSARSLLAVLNDVLDFSKIEAGKMAVNNTDFEFRTLLTGVDKILRATAANKGLSLTITVDQRIPLVVGGDPARLQQVLLNIAGNAIKFTESGQVIILAECLSQDDDQVIIKITVNDTGIGINPNEIDKLFQPFVQADGANARKYLGSGLGLSISASLLNLMNGEIGVTSKKGKGSSFWFTIPFRTVTAASVSGSVSAQQQAELLPAWLAEPLHETEGNTGDVLIVEDNLVNQQVIMAQIRRLGLTSDLAANGQEAVEKAMKIGYKLIFMDCGLPILDGLAATRLIRDKEATAGRHTPIIALTANALPGDREECLAAGMDDCMGKPASGQELRQMVERWLPSKTADSIDMTVLKGLKELADDGQVDICLFVDAYLEEMPVLMDKLRQAMLECNAAQVSAIAHSLKSMSATIGAKRLAELFGKLEQHAKKDNCAEARKLMTNIDIECWQVGTALKTAAGLL